MHNMDMDMDTSYTQTHTSYGRLVNDMSPTCEMEGERRKVASELTVATLAWSPSRGAVDGACRGFSLGLNMCL